jgi:hypothetical protein
MIAEIPGCAEAIRAVEAQGLDHYTAVGAVVTALRTATPAILAAALADIADGMSDDTEWPDGQVLAVYLDTMSARIRERAGL